MEVLGQEAAVIHDLHGGRPERADSCVDDKVWDPAVKLGVTETGECKLVTNEDVVDAERSRIGE